ncbi:MAG TPA: hypothetical protein VM030_07475 [Acidimicrobiales bacterium]|nr:hypothetical protein [Acidimicrobiales bacterium]
MSVYAGRVATEIDRLVIAGHRVAGEAPRPPAMDSMRAHPGLLTTTAIVLLARPLTRDDLGRITPYIAPDLEDALVENNVSEGVLRRDGAHLVLTDEGRMVAEAVVELQDSAVVALWEAGAEVVAGLEDVARAVVAGGRSKVPPSSPDAFSLYADPAVLDRPTPEARVLRAITAVRYWRADAHRAALRAADLGAAEAHALNRLWDAHRGVERVGQGRTEPGTRGLAAIEARGLAADGEITAAGIGQRNAIESDTDARTEPLYATLDETERDRLLAGLRSLRG